MKNKRIYLTLVLSFSFLFFMAFSQCVYAETDGILNILFRHDNNDISGAEFSIYQVADLNVDKTGYNIKPPFKYEGDLNDVKTAEDQIKVALIFENQSNKVNALKKLRTGNDGRVKFSGLKDGIYLVVQTGEIEEATNYTKLQPFLVMVPQFENNQWSKIVTAKPKSEVIRKDTPNSPPTTPPYYKIEKTPKTDDTTDPTRYLGLAMISVSLLILLGGKKKDKRGDRIHEK